MVILGELTSTLSLPSQIVTSPPRSTSGVRNYSHVNLTVFKNQSNYVTSDIIDLTQFSISYTHNNMTREEKLQQTYPNLLTNTQTQKRTSRHV